MNFLQPSLSNVCKVTFHSFIIALHKATWYSRPMKITGLEPQVTDAERVNVFVDGRFLMGASAAVVLQLGLAVGQELLPSSSSSCATKRACNRRSNAPITISRFAHAAARRCAATCAAKKLLPRRLKQPSPA